MLYCMVLFRVCRIAVWLVCGFGGNLVGFVLVIACVCVELGVSFSGLWFA